MVRLVSESDDFVVVMVVNADGTDLVPKGADEQMWVIDRGAIQSRVPLQMNLHYGDLEPVA